jgi:protein-S-isoprenylcysteine O-methyltransferase Ste14
MMLWKWIVFAIVTGVLIFISRASLRDTRSHGFYRFFAWEAFAVLLLFYLGHWFENPFAWYQIIAWIMLCVCLVPAIWGTVLLIRVGKQVEQRETDPNLLGLEKTTQLVTTGIYKYIRHPLYCSLLLLAWGIFFKRPSWTGGGLAAFASVCLLLTARADEAECIRFFGPEYEAYMKETRRFIPFVL